jgi:hypothetical protein
MDGGDYATRFKVQQGGDGIGLEWSDWSVMRAMALMALMAFGV